MRSQNELVLEIMSMCLEYNCETLHIFCGYSGHIDYIKVSIHMGGWSEYIDPCYTNSVYLNAGDTTGYLQLIINELKDIKTEHDLSYAPEYIESTRERERLAKIERLQSEIDELSA